jgi:hypothetical protein
MKFLSRTRIVTLASVACLIGAPGVLRAQATKIFVASFGSDSNDGSRGAPKRNFQAAHNAVAAGGQIVVLDTAGYGQLTISKSISVTVPPGVNGSVTVTGSANGVTINAASSDVVSLRGLIVDGGGSGSGGDGILVNSVSALTVQDCTLRNFNAGLFLFPTNNAQLHVYNTDARNCTYGMLLDTNGATASVASVNGCRFQGNTTGLFAIPGGGVSGGTVDVSMADCVVTGNTTGILAESTLAMVRVNNCNITGNTTGIAPPQGGGKVLSRGNNTLENNTNGNTFNFAYSAK